MTDDKDNRIANLERQINGLKDQCAAGDRSRNTLAAAIGGAVNAFAPRSSWDGLCTAVKVKVDDLKTEVQNAKMKAKLSAVEVRMLKTRIEVLEGHLSTLGLGDDAIAAIVAPDGFYEERTEDEGETKDVDGAANLSEMFGQSQTIDQDVGGGDDADAA